MKKLFALLVMQLISYSAWSQTMNIHYKNGQTVEYNMDNIDYVEFTEKKENNTQVSSEKAVDLGLTVKWASYNVGAESPEQFGDMYAWGETSPKDKYKKENYLYYDSNTESYYDIGLDIKGTDYDVAHVKWGGKWRMPTLDELKELKEDCDWEWGQYNGVNGYIVTGPNGNSIFLPSSGNSSICLWASHISKNRDEGGNSKMAACFGIKYDSIGNTIGRERYTGNYIRPVTPR